MFAIVHNNNPPPPGQREPCLTLHSCNDEDLTPPIKVYLPPTLTADEFLALFPTQQPNNPSSSKPPAFTFPALHNWFAKLHSNCKLQHHDESHPFYKHPYKLREIDVQAVDWFWRNRPGGQEDKLGFMKIQAKIETDEYLHDGEEKERADWLPGAVFLRGGSVGVLVCHAMPHLLTSSSPHTSNVELYDYD